MVVVQSRRFDAYGRRVVVPLVRADEVRVVERTLNPTFVVAGVAVILHPLDLASVPAGRLGPVVASLSGEGDAIVTAHDLTLSRAWG